MRRTVSILGSTGSIGTSALDLIERLNALAGGDPPFRVAALAAHRSVDRLIEQVRRFRPALACIGTEEAAARVREEVGGLGTRVVWGRAGLLEAATCPAADFVLAGIVGAAGLEPTHAAVCAGRTVGLANKEALVMAGDLMMAAARASGAVLLPVDSEHNALHQCLRGESIEEVRALILTASGGPFWRESGRDLSSITPREALAHPTWVMGPKISIDSATLMNKGLEVIEAHWLFGVPSERIKVVVHPQSIVHSMVEFVDGSIVCQMGATDMRHPIQYALTWPERTVTPLPAVDLAALPALTFQPPDLERFPCLGLGWEALRAGGTMPAVLNAANEVAVAAFLDGAASFTDIPSIIRSTLEAHRPRPASSLNAVLDADAWARRVAAGLLQPGGAGALERSGGIT
jgi:1-deoxy-D-xylulose-5-phosphate reductoisomerase